MSHKKDLEIIKKLVSERCEGTFACNSIKLRFGCDEDKRGVRYIWIDPPWKLQLHDNVVTTAWDCPHPEDVNYDEKFEEWCSLLSPLDSTILTGYQFDQEETLILEFTSGLKLDVPKDDESEDDDELWYDHWYASELGAS
ncbi:MAG: hypothetical protein ACE5KO_05505 [Candidatus Bathyarchaeia archaeon]